MRKALLFISLSLLLIITACNSAGFKEVLEYHNGFVDEVIVKTEKIDAAYDKMELAETDEEILEISQKEILPVLDEIKAYMDAQEPKVDDTKEYHQLRSDWFNLYNEIVRTEIQTMDDYINDRITEEEFDEIYEEAFPKLAEVEKLAGAAEDKINELSEKYKFEEIEE